MNPNAYFAMLHQLIYISHTIKMLAADELTDLLTRSRLNNEASQVTGILLYHEGAVIQVLEGEEHTVRDLYKKIQKDHRHDGIIILLDTPIEARSFPKWSMGFKPLSSEDFSSIKGFVKLDELREFATQNLAISPEAVKLIRSFTHVNLDRHPIY